MKAITHDRYGSAEVLRFGEIPEPVINDDQVMVRVRAASLNPLDWHFMRGQPYLVRLMGMAIRTPRDGRIGADVAGVVERVGSAVTEFKPGDEVFGFARGSCSEFVRGTERRFAPKPARMSFEEAAAVPVAGATALQAVRDHGRVQPGQTVLVIGASGGVGTYAVQIAKAFGAEVTGVCSGRNVEMVASLGADHVIDYTAQDFARAEQRYDVVLQIAGSRSLRACRKALKPSGTLVEVGGEFGNWGGFLVRMLAGAVLSRVSSRKVKSFIASETKEDLLFLAQLIKEGKLRSVIDRTVPLAETPEALAYLEQGHARGKVVVTVG